MTIKLFHVLESYTNTTSHTLLEYCFSRTLRCCYTIKESAV